MTQPARLGDVSFWYADIGLPEAGGKEVVVFETATSGVWVSPWWLKT